MNFREGLKRTFLTAGALIGLGAGALQAKMVYEQGEEIRGLRNGLAEQDKVIRGLRQTVTDDEKLACHESNHQTFLDEALREIYGVGGGFPYTDCDKKFPDSDKVDPRLPGNSPSS